MTGVCWDSDDEDADTDRLRFHDRLGRRDGARLVTAGCLSVALVVRVGVVVLTVVVALSTSRRTDCLWYKRPQ